MKKLELFVFALVLSLGLQAQDARFTVEISTDSILMGNYFEVKFTLENASGNNFSAPDFMDFNIIGGPNTSSSMSFMNGEMTQSISYTYYLEPKDIGSYYIQPASIETGGDILETIPMEVMVVPNPEGLKQMPRQREQRHSFFDDFWNDMPQFEAPPQPYQDPKPKETQPKKKKRKTIKI